MGPNIALSCSLLICFLVDVGICLSCGERNFRPSNAALIKDISKGSPDEKVHHSGDKLLRKFRSVPNKGYDEEEDEEDDVAGAPPDHQGPYSEHEDPEEPPTKPKYVKPGDWAKPPADKNIPLDFVPTKLYAQVRGTHTVKRVPRKEAIATAETAEEIISAPRLREVVSKSKKNTVYTEEGYEDSAYDHAGHIRDADFHEGFARKLDDKRKSKQDTRNKKLHGREEEFKDEGSGDDEEEFLNEESGDDEEREYDDDYRDHAEETKRVEETNSSKREDKKAKGEKNTSIKGYLRNPNTNPKHVTENEIVRLEEDLEKEYAESEKNVEDEVPENLKNSRKEDEDEENEAQSENLKKSEKDDEDETEKSQSENLKKSGNDDEDDAEESKNEEDFRNDYDYGKRMHKNTDASKKTSRHFLRSQRGEKKFGNKEFPIVSSTQSVNLGSTSTSVSPTEFQKESSAGFTVYEDFRNSQNQPGDFSSTTPNYGKVFWDYFKLVGDHWKPNRVSTPTDIITTMTETVTLVPEEVTSVPNFKPTLSKQQDINTSSFSPPTTFSFSPSTTQLNDFLFSSTNMGNTHPGADSLYESWKRQDRGFNSRDRPDFGSMEAASNSYPEEFEVTTKFGRDPSMNMKHDETTTLKNPKKLSYTVIIRPKDKSTTTSSLTDHEVHNRPEPTNSIGQLTSPKYTTRLKYFRDQPNPQEINNIAVEHQDFTVMQPPLSVPLRQVTYTDFLPDTYGSSVHQSVTQESGQLEKKVNGGRDWYHGLEAPYDKRFSNLFSHASEAPHFHHHRHRGHQSPAGNKRNHPHRNFPPTKLLPPPPIIRNSYADYLVDNRLARPRTRFDRSPRLDPWNGLLELYRTIDRSIFGRRRRRSLERELKIEESNDAKRKSLRPTSNQRGNVHYRILNAPSETVLPERNFLREEANRLVTLGATAIVNLASDGNPQREKTSVMRKRRNHEELLKSAPEIAEEEINAEIKSRFDDDEKDDEDDEEDDEEKYNASTEKQRGKVDVQIPDFDVSEIIKQINNNKNEKIVSEHPTEANKLDFEKYPFYDNSKVPESSALKYITNPRQVPRKTLGGTEFYDSRDRYLECDEVEPNLDSVVPEKEEPVSDREQKGDKPRLHGLGDKLDCFRAKYFDQNPLDNPLFLEKQIDQPRIPEEFDPAKFASRIFEIPTENQEQRDVVVRGSKKPEIRDLRRSGSRKNQVAHENEENSQQVKSTNHRKEENDATKNRRNRRKRPERPGQKKNPEPTTTEPPQYYPVTPYERQVYEDVMGTIKNLAGLYQAYGEPLSPPLVPTNLNHVPPDRETDWNYPLQITERPKSFLIHGLLPPQTTAASNHQPFQRYRAFPYRTNKVSYRMRFRTENPPGQGKKVGYFKTVTVHKRSVDDTSTPQELDMKKSGNIEVQGEKNWTASTSFKKEISKDSDMMKKLSVSKVPGRSDMDPEESGNITESVKKNVITSLSFNEKPIQDIGMVGKSVARKVPEEPNLDIGKSRNSTISGKDDLFSTSTLKMKILENPEKEEMSAAKKITAHPDTDIDEPKNILAGKKNNLTISSSANKKGTTQNTGIEEESARKKISAKSDSDYDSTYIAMGDKKPLMSSLTFKNKTSDDEKKNEKLSLKKVPAKSDTYINEFRNNALSGKKILINSFTIKKNTPRDSGRQKNSASKGGSEVPDLDTGESRNFAARGRKNLTSGFTHKKKTNQDIEKQEKPAASERIIYTIRDRIRHSKPRNGFGKNGKFSNLQAAGTEDVRRHEPRYNQIRRKNVSPSSPRDEEVDENVSTVTSLKTQPQRDKTTGRQDFHDEPGEIYKIQFSTTRGTQTAPAANKRRADEDAIDDEEDYEEEKQSEESINDDNKGINYAVRENVKDDVTTLSTLNVEPTETPEYRKLQKYLQSEPPGYSEAFNENSAELEPRYNRKNNKERGADSEEELDEEDEEPPSGSYQRAETRRDNEKEGKGKGKEDEEQGDEESERPSESYAEEESSEKSGEAEDVPESRVESESYKNDDDEESKDDDSSRDGEEEFHRFASRPLSPYESYDDPKYSDLGPRLEKPAFHHPSFSEPIFTKNQSGKYSAESERGSDEEGSEKTSRYIFPWEEDEREDVEETKDSGHSIGRYEYPWEKRERLAKERRKKEKARRDYEKLFTFSNESEEDEEGEEEEQNASNTELRGKHIYPWDYDVPSKNHHRDKFKHRSQPIDNVEVGTEYRPVTKFSSRYKSKIFNIHDEGDPIVVSGADPSRIRDSVIESIKKASQSKPVDPIEVLKNLVQSNTTKVATSTSNSYIVPEETSTIPPKRLRNWKKISSTSLITTIAPTTTTRPTRTGANQRIWQTASTTTKKPFRTRKKISSLVDNELLKSGSQKRQTLEKNSISKNKNNSSMILPSVVGRKTRRRGQMIKQSHNSTSTTARPVRRRLSKSTAAPKLVEETTMKTITDRTTTPKSKTVEHRSRFSKEEIITKTLYPGLNDDEDEENNKDRNHKDHGKNERKDSKKGNTMNESVKKVSIVTKETPEHIYRTEEIDKDGVKGMFVSITPNNGSSSMDSMEHPEDRLKDDEDTKEIIKRFRDFDEKDNEQDAEDSLMQDSHLMANLLNRVPPFFNDFTFEETFQGEENNYLETEGSGDEESNEDDSGPEKIQPKIIYEKNPNDRLYYYLEK